MSLSELSEGRKVLLSDGREAVIRFAGQTSFAAGVWVGIELADDSGKNDGSVQGERYFECPLGHGMFVRPTSLKVLAGQPAPFLPPAKKKAARPSSTVSSKGSASESKQVGTAPSIGAPARVASGSRVSLACSSLLLLLYHSSAPPSLCSRFRVSDASSTRSKQC